MCAASHRARADFPLQVAANATLPYRFGSNKYKSHRPHRRKKSPVPAREQGRTGWKSRTGAWMLADFYNHHKLPKLLLPELLLRYCGTALLRCCRVALLRYSGVALQLGPSPSTSPRCNPLLSRARDCCDCALFALLRLPTALLPCHVGQTRQTAINGTVQNNAGEDRVDGLGDLSLHGKQFM